MSALVSEGANYRRRGFQVIGNAMEKTADTTRLVFLLVAAATILAACAAPNPNTPTGQAEIAGQECTVCIVENPGDGTPCYAICSQKEEDQAAYQRAYGR
jgi:hypothetical protein